ncbi:hypothetical protein QG37_03896 [Candidozyma auris]|nr:hypothetical protein QG37_03896 [[Candida] auris]
MGSNLLKFPFPMEPAVGKGIKGVTFSPFFVLPPQQSAQQ